MNVVVAAAVAEEEVVVDVRIRDLVPAHANLAVLYDGVRFLKFGHIRLRKEIREGLFYLDFMSIS